MDIAFEPEFEIATETVSHDFKMVGDCSELFAAVAKAQSNFRALPETKEANVKTYTYTYADLAAVLECVRPCLNAQGISVMQSATMGRVQTILGHSLEDQLRAGGLTSAFQKHEPFLVLKLMTF